MYFVANRKLTQRLKEEKCYCIPFKYYLPTELLTKEMTKRHQEEETKE